MMKGALTMLTALVGGLSAGIGGAILGALAGFIVEQALRKR